MGSVDYFNRHVLFAVLAERAAYVATQDLVDALETWLRDRSRPLDQLLLEKGLIDARTRESVEVLVERHLELRGHDVCRCLSELEPFPAHVARLLSRPWGDETLPADPGAVGVPTQPRSDDPRLPSGGISDAGTRAERFRQPEVVTRGTESQAVHFQGEAAFALLRPLAEGGLGEVLVARDAALNREVALKQIHARLKDDLPIRARFLFEAEITAGLEHPSIVPIYALGTSRDGRPFYAMRLVQGETLDEAIRRFHRDDGLQRDPVRFRRLLGHVISICHAVAYAHSRGVLHRDLKPSNMLLGKFGETLLVDWGLAKLIDQSDAPEPGTSQTDRLDRTSGSTAGATLAGTAVGTPRYMSPEQASGRSEDIGPASDVYGLGATLYCLLTGQAPLSEITKIGPILQAVAAGEIPAPRTLSRKVPRTLESICQKAMALRPENRYPSATALAEDLEHWRTGEGGVQPQGPPDRDGQ